MFGWKEPLILNDSWRPAWEKWLTGYSGTKKKTPELGNPEKEIRPICDAPGTYVLKK